MELAHADLAKKTIFGMNIFCFRYKHIKDSKEHLFIMTQTLGRLRVCVIINKRSFEPFMCLDLVLER